MSNYGVVLCKNGEEDFLYKDKYPAVDIDYKKGFGANASPENRPQACAKKLVRSTGNSLYFVKMNDGNELYNPFDISHSKDRDLTIAGVKVWQMKPVNQRCFNYYSEYLITGNSKTLVNAGREIT